MSTTKKITDKEALTEKKTDTFSEFIPINLHFFQRKKLRAHEITAYLLQFGSEYSVIPSATWNSLHRT
jgi:hypothetical protein